MQILTFLIGGQFRTCVSHYVPSCTSHSVTIQTRGSNCCLHLYFASGLRVHHPAPGSAQKYLIFSLVLQREVEIHGLTVYEQ